MIKQYESLSLPTTMFMDCTGSYLLGIYNYLADESSKDDILFYLLNCRIKYVKLDLEELKKTYFNNPWGYQPVKLFTSTDKELFTLETYEEFCGFLRETFNFEVCNEGIDPSTDINDKINADMEHNKVVVAFVDEKYIPHNTKFYKKQTNYHGLLIKKTDTDAKRYFVIDPEYPQGYEVAFEHMKEAVEAGGLGYTSVRCGEFRNGLEINQTLDTGNLGNLDFFTSLIEDITYRLNPDSDENLEYFYRGYYCSILFKIIPFIKMRNHYLKKTGYVSHEVLSQSEKIVLLWEELAPVMLTNLRLQDLTSGVVVEALKRIAGEEAKLNIN